MYPELICTRVLYAYIPRSRIFEWLQVSLLQNKAHFVPHIFSKWFSSFFSYRIAHSFLRHPHIILISPLVGTSIRLCFQKSSSFFLFLIFRRQSDSAVENCSKKWFKSVKSCIQSLSLPGRYTRIFPVRKYIVMEFGF